MLATIITPYTNDFNGTGDYGPLVVDLWPTAKWADVTDRRMPGQNAIPTTNLYVIQADLTGQQLAQVKSDSRFFVLDPGPGYNGNALANWLDGKGAVGHGVTGSESAEQARQKVISYCRSI